MWIKNKKTPDEEAFLVWLDVEEEKERIIVEMTEAVFIYAKDIQSNPAINTVTSCTSYN